MLNSYINELKAEIVTRARALDLKPEATRYRLRNVKPLTLQIEELMRSLPSSLRDRPWSMCDLVNRLEGKYRERPHAAKVGQALRALGWVRLRDWTISGDGSRVWVAPYQRHRKLLELG